MKFAHLSDCHIGSWRDPRLNEASTKAFINVMEICKKENVDFILIAGDLFDTALPSVDRLKEVTLKLKGIREEGINVYVIPGSHDFSPTGKTMLDVLENAGLFINVAKGHVEDGMLKLKFTVDEKTGAKITGIPGMKGTLERKYYEKLHLKNLEEETGFKIFVLHSMITELKPEKEELGESTPASLLPRGFNYYAGGHPHRVIKKRIEGYGLVAYPSPLFPNNMAELEKLHNGGFYIVEADGEKTEAIWHPVIIFNVFPVKIDCNFRTPQQVEEEIIGRVKNRELFHTIVTIRLEGKLKSGKISDINFSSIFEFIYSRGAHFIMKNTAALTSEEFQEIRTAAKTIDEIEEELIREHKGQVRISSHNEEELAKKLMKMLDIEKEEGETNITFENRIKGEISALLNI